MEPTLVTNLAAAPVYGDYGRENPQLTSCLHILSGTDRVRCLLGRFLEPVRVIASLPSRPSKTQKDDGSCTSASLAAFRHITLAWTRQLLFLRPKMSDDSITLGGSRFLLSVLNLYPTFHVDQECNHGLSSKTGTKCPLLVSNLKVRASLQ